MIYNDTLLLAKWAGEHLTEEQAQHLVAFLVKRWNMIINNSSEFMRTYTRAKEKEARDATSKHRRK